MTITGIRKIRGRKPRYAVSLDGESALELSDWTIGKFGLRTGDDLDEAALAKIKSMEEETQAKNVAINYLSYRPRSSKEIIDHLAKKGFDRRCSTQIVQHLETLKMVNDTEFAFTFVRDRMKKRPVGHAFLRQQLLAKGITGATAEKVLGELLTPASQQQAALQAAKKKLRDARTAGGKSDNEKRKKRLLDFLLRRGFSYEIAVKTIRTTMER